MLSLTCHCGTVRVDVNCRPDYVNECNCTLCAKAGARWGYFNPEAVTISGTTSAYERFDVDQPTAVLQFCRVCGSTTHYELTEFAQQNLGPDAHIGVNMRLASDDDLQGVEVRYADGRNWSGSGAFGYVRPARHIGTDA